MILSNIKLKQTQPPRNLDSIRLKFVAPTSSAIEKIRAAYLSLTDNHFYELVSLSDLSRAAGLGVEEVRRVLNEMFEADPRTVRWAGDDVRITGTYADELTTKQLGGWTQSDVPNAADPLPTQSTGRELLDEPLFVPKIWQIIIGKGKVELPKYKVGRVMLKHYTGRPEHDNNQQVHAGSRAVHPEGKPSGQSVSTTRIARGKVLTNADREKKNPQEQIYALQQDYLSAGLARQEAEKEYKIARGRRDFANAMVRGYEDYVKERDKVYNRYVEDLAKAAEDPDDSFYDEDTLSSMRENRDRMYKKLESAQNGLQGAKADFDKQEKDLSTASRKFNDLSYKEQQAAKAYANSGDDVLSVFTSDGHRVASDIVKYQDDTVAGVNDPRIAQLDSEIRELRKHLLNTPIGNVDELAKINDEIDKRWDETWELSTPSIDHANRQLKPEDKLTMQESYVDDPLGDTRQWTQGVKSALEFVPQNDLISKTSVEVGMMTRDDVWLAPVDTGRAYARDNKIYMSAYSDTKTVVHEMGHVIESADPLIHRMTMEFYQKRTQGEATEPLSAVTGNQYYKADEVTRKDKFIDPYMGKHYSDGGASEIISMGLQLFYEDPIKFARQDPEMFAFIYAVLRVGGKL